MCVCVYLEEGVCVCVCEESVCVPGGGRVDRPAEVCDLQLPVGSQQQVLWLDVPVDHLLRVAVVQSIRQLHDVLRREESER